MTILDLLASHPHLFRTDQTWFADEDFVRLDLTPLPRMPRKAITCKAVSVDDVDELTDAVLLLDLYTRFPDNPIWVRHYLWCADTDRYGQRVFIGVNDGKMEIHRFLHITNRWAVPCF